MIKWKGFVLEPVPDKPHSYILCIEDYMGTGLPAYWDNEKGKWIPIETKPPSADVTPEGHK